MPGWCYFSVIWLPYFSTWLLLCPHTDHSIPFVVAVTIGGSTTHSPQGQGWELKQETQCKLGYTTLNLHVLCSPNIWYYSVCLVNITCINILIFSWEREKESERELFFNDEEWTSYLIIQKVFSGQVHAVRQIYKFLWEFCMIPKTCEQHPVLYCMQKLIHVDSWKYQHHKNMS